VVARTVSGARYGVRDWLVQRFSAVYLAIYGTVFVVVLAAHGPLEFVTWRAWFESPWIRYATLLFAISLYLHAWVGMRDVFMDYLKPTWLRLSAEAVSILALVLYSVWTVSILWRLS
jgi:succinate dehydrogenase / fumarate reductase membrane anchor subunit